MNITLKQLHGFRAVAELGGFTRAAERLHIAQPALSLSIRELEQELNAKLLERTTRRVELTAAGREFLLSVNSMIELLELAVNNARDLSERKRGKLVIAAPPLLAAMIAPGAVAQYKAMYPGIDVRLIDTQTNVIVDRIRSGEVDCAMGTFSDAEEGVRRELLFEDELMLFCSDGSPLKSQQRPKWAHLESQPVIVLTQDSGIRSLVQKAYHQAGIPLKPTFEVAHISTAVMMVEAGLGVSPLPAYAWNFAKAFKVVARHLSAPNVRREVSFVHASSRTLSPAADGFYRILRKRARSALPRPLRDQSP
jgi:DNA-binding transcriptional LysR family regulator